MAGLRPRRRPTLNATVENRGGSKRSLEAESLKYDSLGWSESASGGPGKCVDDINRRSERPTHTTPILRRFECQPFRPGMDHHQFVPRPPLADSLQPFTFRAFGLWTSARAYRPH